ncbi:MAG: NUDIX hydrolase [Rhodocyclaceae bacterium]|nr:NUDIX hydrolase [Rhodocyclaceae bacterium]
MNEHIWRPHVTVAAVIERDGRFLLVEEETSEGLRLNQPAGHLDEGESLWRGCQRETLEETAYHFEPQALIGVYQWRNPESGVTYLRFAFSGELGPYEADRPLDVGIVRTVWLAREEIAARRAQHRSPLVWRCIEDYLAGRRYPLELIHHYSGAP